MSEMTPAEAAALIKADSEHRVKLAAEAVQAALTEHGCDLVAVPQIAADGRVVAVVQIVAR